VAPEWPLIVDGDGHVSAPLIVGRISAVFGVHGWVKVYSHTSPAENILHYQPWYLLIDGCWQARNLVEARSHGKGLIALLEGCADRSQAAGLVGREVALRREQLPELQEGEYYWADLEGLRVRTCEGVDLGRLDHLFETGANDVMVVRGERDRLIPYLWGSVVRSVDLEAGLMVVEWDPEF
jgi:16S rRNA processing protein RimM